MSDYTDNLEATQQTAAPEFYVITSGSSVERYTSYSTDLTFMGQLFKAAAIKRGGLVRDTKFGVDKIQVTVPLSPNIAAYIPNQPIEPVTVTIYRSTLANLNSYAIFFKGKIAFVQIKDKMATAQIQSRSKILLRKIPSIIYQSFCNHDIFDSGCSLDEYVYLRTGIVATLSDNNATVSVSWTDGKGDPDIGDFQGGRMVLDTDLRLITGHSVIDEFQIQIPFDSRMKIGATLSLYPGCDGSPETCGTRFDNLTHHLGMSYIPSSNPVLWGFK
ncbi:MAG: DUF2163 domain-containing protein [Desulfobacula sp.]|jgi:uncharacterized phage protein (TIGR02218 family)|nr:DUF2163 domain-containing protein [Desulfobacula sp.]